MFSVFYNVDQLIVVWYLHAENTSACERLASNDCSTFVSDVAIFSALKMQKFIVLIKVLLVSYRYNSGKLARRTSQTNNKSIESKQIRMLSRRT